MLKRLAKILIASAFIAGISLHVGCAASVTSAGLLAKVKAAEIGFSDIQANMVIEEASKKNVSSMGEGYSDILKLEKAILKFKKPDLLRFDGYAQGIKAIYIQNGYTKLIVAAMIRQKQNVKNAPGKRQDTMDMGFLSTRLWQDNNVKVITTKGSQTILDFKPKFGGKDKRHDKVWIDNNSLKLLKREKYLGSGEMRVKMEYNDFEKLTAGLAIATTTTMYAPNGKFLGTISYQNMKINTGFENSIFSLSTKQ